MGHLKAASEFHSDQETGSVARAVADNGAAMNSPWFLDENY